MKHIIFNNRIGCFLILFLCAVSVNGQGSRNSYFMNSPYSHRLNPALQPHRGYIGFPGLSDLNLSIGAGTTVNRVLYPLGDSLVTFLHPEIKKDHNVKNLFHKRISPFLGLDYNLVSFGWFSKESFLSFGMNARVDAALHIPRGLLEFLDKGSNNMPYDLGFGLTANAYIENAFGYSRIIDHKLTVGAKFKYLLGIGNINANLKGTTLTANENIWQVALNGSLKVNGLAAIEDEIPDEMLPDSLKSGNSKFRFPEGHGIGIDLGATYKLLENLTVSAALLDIGFISWKSDYYQTNIKNRTLEYEGMDLSNLDSIEFGQIYEDQIDTILSELQLAKNTNNKRRTTSLYTSFSLGGEYRFYDDKLSAGLLYRAKITPMKWYNGVTASLNYRPYNNLNLVASYSFFDDWSAFGFAVNYRPAYFLNVFFGLDYIPLWVSNQFIPLGYKNFAFQFGLTIPLRVSKYIALPSTKSF